MNSRKQLLVGCLISMAAGRVSAQLASQVTLDDVFAEVGHRVPAFGGLFGDDPSDPVYMYMAPRCLGDLATLDQVLTDVLVCVVGPELDRPS